MHQAKKQTWREQELEIAKANHVWFGTEREKELTGIQSRTTELGARCCSTSCWRNCAQSFWGQTPQHSRGGAHNYLETSYNHHNTEPRTELSEQDVQPSKRSKTLCFLYTACGCSVGGICSRFSNLQQRCTLQGFSASRRINSTTSLKLFS